MNEVKRGDIYYIVSNYQEEGCEQRAGRPAVIVSNNLCNEHSSVVEIVYLTTQPKNELPTHIDIRSASKPSIALCEQICSVSKDRLGTYVGACNKYELDMLDAALLISLGIDFPATTKREKMVDPVKPVETIKKTQAENETAELKNDLRYAQAERDTFERLYNDLLEKLIGRKIAV